MAVRYTHVVDELRSRIKSGALPAGDRLPSEGELAATYRVGLPTLRRALDVLQAEGLIEKFHGRGNFVRPPIRPVTYVSGCDAQTVQPAGSSLLKVDVRVTELEAQGGLLPWLQVPAGTPLVERVYLSKQAGVPCSLARVYVPRVLDGGATEVPQSPWGDDVLAQLFARGVRLAATRERTVARFPTAEEAEELHVVTRAPVLVIERTSTDSDGRVLVGSLLLLPGGRAEALFATVDCRNLEEAR
ncbi:GntR family transcriptional regulator [Kitasatospora sp. GAS204B]|uniref:GntR family transcriptional regulator n=1 Tax=unclassified Kitasatospora TaxID=2633591 RepID=UPI002474CFDD|nr:GntR family transcriptional regulator [Kitasatospora sp. GAS204B]MDH6119319.1 GntR family transcriptional regulator [Kitasatospora sp. GAS204B]